MKRFFIHPGITPTMSFTGSCCDLRHRTQSSSEGTQPNTSFRCRFNRQAKFYYENVVYRYVLISFYLSNAIVYVFCTCHVFSSFLLCCNASAFVICAIKNYLLTSFFRFVTIDAFGRRTDRRTDRKALAIPFLALHAVAR